MIAKEKAEELLANFGDIDHLGVIGDFTGNWEWSSSLWRRQAKEAALICVDEIINSNPHSNPMNTYGFSTMAYWMEVKQELKKL